MLQGSHDLPRRLDPAPAQALPGAEAVTAAPLGFGVSGALALPFFPAPRARELVRLAYGLGVRFFDTAPAYGHGACERRLGDALTGLPRASITLATKVGLQASGRDFSPDGVRRSLDASLQRLRTSHVDLLFLHGPAPHEITDTLIATLVGLREGGRIRAIGVTGRGAEMEVAVATGEIAHVMAPLNMHLGETDRARLATFKAAGIGLIAIEALRPALARSRTLSSVGGLWRLARGVLRREPAKAAAQQGETTSPREAISWALGPGGADLILTTTTRRTRLRANIEAARLSGAPPTRILTPGA